MNFTKEEFWARFQQHYTEFPSIKLALDLSPMNFGKDYLSSIHKGAIRGARGPFENLLAAGMSGSARGPQFVAQALGHPATNLACSKTVVVLPSVLTLADFLLAILYKGLTRSLTLTITYTKAFAVGVLIALFEQAVGFYAWFIYIHVNAHHQQRFKAGNAIYQLAR